MTNLKMSYVPPSSAATTNHRMCLPNSVSFFNYSHVAITGNFVSRKQLQRLILCSLPRTQQHAVSAADRLESRSITRRDATLKISFSAIFRMLAASASAIFSSPAVALPTEVPADYRLYSDDVNKYKIIIPQDWQVGTGATDGIKSITAFYPESSSASNITVAITGLGPDFTRLESFGKVDSFAENLVNGLDRSWQRPPGVAAKLIDSRAANGLYYIEYTLQNPGDSSRHIYSALGMAQNGWYNRLYTVTGQFVEEEKEKFSSAIEKAVQSFRLG